MDLTYEVYTYDIAEAVFAREVLAAGWRHCHALGWDTSARALSPAEDWEEIFIQEGEDKRYGTYRVRECLVYVSLRGGRLEAYAAGPENVVEVVRNEIERLYPRVALASQEVEYGFWHAGRAGRHNRRTRAIEVPTWSTIAFNYAASTRLELDRMMELERADHGGRLSVWYGEPGTGKTFALRALSWAWREWCKFEYILDPERFFADPD